MRVDAAGHDDPAARIDQPALAEIGKAPRSATATTLPPAIATSAGPMLCGVTTQSPVMTRSTIVPTPRDWAILRRPALPCKTGWAEDAGRE